MANTNRKFELGDVFMTNCGRTKNIVVGVKELIHGKYCPNTDIVQQICVKGPRGALKVHFVHASGGTKYCDTFTFEGHYIYDGINGGLKPAQA